MTLSESLYAYLASDSGVKRLVGARIYFAWLPKLPQLPAITCRQISRRPVHVRPGLANPIVAVRMQFDVLATEYASLELVAAALKAALYGFAQANAPRVYGTRVDSEMTMPPTDVVHGRRVIDAFVWYAEE
ncbi:MAG: DUF3168 domain-containing protein [Caldilineaceae bacterium]